MRAYNGGCKRVEPTDPRNTNFNIPNDYIEYISKSVGMTWSLHGRLVRERKSKTIEDTTGERANKIFCYTRNIGKNTLQVIDMLDYYYKYWCPWTIYVIILYFLQVSKDWMND